MDSDSPPRQKSFLTSEPTPLSSSSHIVGDNNGSAADEMEPGSTRRKHSSNRSKFKASLLSEACMFLDDADAFSADAQMELFLKEEKQKKARDGEEDEFGGNQSAATKRLLANLFSSVHTDHKSGMRSGGSSTQASRRGSKVGAWQLPSAEDFLEAAAAAASGVGPGGFSAGGADSPLELDPRVAALRRRQMRMLMKMKEKDEDERSGRGRRISPSGIPLNPDLITRGIGCQTWTKESSRPKLSLQRAGDLQVAADQVLSLRMVASQPPQAKLASSLVQKNSLAAASSISSPSSGRRK